MLKQSRLDALADGIFAIVMTLLVLEIRIPEMITRATEQDLWLFFVHEFPLFISYTLSFTLLFVYWRGHHYIASVLARNVDNRLANINAIFLLLVGLVPFSTHFLGSFNYTQTAIIFYGINMICISLTLFWMRLYIRNATNIETIDIDHDTEIRGMMRIIMPMLMACAAIILSFVNTYYSLALFSIAIFFNLSDSSAKHLITLFRFFMHDILHWEHQNNHPPKAKSRRPRAKKSEPILHE